MLIEKFEEQVNKTPGNIAIKSRDQTLTYLELNGQANRIARMIGAGTGNEIVGLLFDHGVHMIAAILGALKAGKTYVPLSADYPMQRLAYMLSDSEASLIVTCTANEALAQKLGKDRNIPVIDIETGNQDAVVPGENPSRTRSGEKLAYIMYTSGSTGRPKGVMQNHQNVLYYTRNWVRAFSIAEDDKVILLASFCHDMSVQDIFSALQTGAVLLPYDVKKQQKTGEFKEFLNEEKITLWHSVPTLLRYFINTLTVAERFGSLRYMQLGGERVLAHDIDKVKKHFPNTRLAVIYGQTESSVDSIFFIREKESYQKPLLGTPLEGISLYVVDNEGSPVKPLRSGEILAAGHHISPGYWKMPEVTTQVFDRDQDLGIIYWTGDMGRLLVDGNIEFLGRIDQQIKIRGFRVEMGEIESRLLNYPGIKEAVVLAHEEETGDNYICAYIVSDREYGISGLREYLAKELPDYMIPAYFVQTEQIPLTTSGKIDRKALPKPGLEVGESYTAPRNEIEKKLVKIWNDILNLSPDSDLRIGIDDNFFHLGGHSLKAIQLTARIHRIFDVKISLGELYRTPTIRGIASAVTGAEQTLFTDIKKAEEKDFYELSFNQKRLWFIQQMEPTSSAYNIPGRIILNHHVEDEWIETTLARLAHRHESLRTGFKIVADRPVQRLIKEAAIPLKKIDISMLAGEEQQRKQEEIFNEMARTPFDLTEAPLCRTVLLKLDQQAVELMFNIHHIITDGWSMEIIKRDFTLLYEGSRTGKTVELESLPFQYKDFAAWYNDWLQHPLNPAGSHSYWKTKLEKGLPGFTLPGDFTGWQESREGAGYRCIIEKNITKRIKRLAEGRGTTLFTVMFSVYLLLLSRLSGQQEVICSIIGAGREHESLHHIVGFFVNSIIYNTQVEFKEPFHGLLERVNREVLVLFQHQNYPPELVFEELGMRYPGIPVTFNMLTIQESAAAYELDSLAPSHIENPGQVKFDLEPYVTEYKNGIQMTWNYKKNLFHPETIAFIANEYIKMIDFLTGNPGKSYLDYRKSIPLSEPVPERKPYPVEPGWETIPQVFAYQVKKTPDRIAVKVGNSHFTYNELDSYASRIACLIGEKLERRPGDNRRGNERVGLLFEHGYDMIAAIMGVLRAGKVYVPLSASYPVKRLSYMLSDSESSLLLTNTNNIRLAAVLAGENQIGVGEVNGLDRNSGDVFMEKPGITGDSPAYILYTSGSTGNPKGVVQNHENVLYYTRNWGRVFSISIEDKMTLFSSFCHDGSVQDMFGALLNGAVLYPYDMKNREESAPDLPGFLSKEKITIWHSVPSLFGYFVNNFTGTGVLPGLRFILLGGEPLRAHEVAMAGKYFPYTTLANIYGQTESSVSSIWLIHPGDREGFSKVIIGEPLDNTGIILMDEEQDIVGPLETGEIIVACPHLALGYWKNGEATQKVFSNHPVYGKMYRTGDMGRLLIGGSIEFTGRKDNQVKIRGFRIELGEIESWLLKHEYIDGAVVKLVETGDDSGDNYLCAYIVGKNPGGLDKGIEMLSAELKVYLSELLPDYMIPTFFIRLERLPLTPGGKVDREALPLPGIGEINRRTFVAPRTWVEIKLLEVWRAVLKFPGVIGIEDDFFELGGHSLRATALASRIQKALNVAVPLTEIFKRPTIRGLAAYIDAAKKERYASIEPVEKKEYHALSPAQMRLYILHRMETGSLNYNMPQVIPFPGVIDVERMRSVFMELIRRHESLRTSFEMIDEEPVQRIKEEVEVKVEVEEVRSSRLEGTRRLAPLSFIRPFDLSKAPLLRAGIIDEGNGNHILLVDMHHIITDGTSNGILRDEFTALYMGKGEELSHLRLQYIDYAYWQSSEVQRAVIKKQEIYWLNIFAQGVQVLNLPTDYPRPIVQSFEGIRVDFILSGEESAALKLLAKETGATLYISILSVFTLLLSRLSGQEDIVVGTPVAARRHADLEKIIGMFVNTLALRNNVPAEASYREFVKELKDRTLKAYENQEYQFETLVEKINVARDIGRNPVFDVMFNLLNMEHYTGRSPVIDLESSDHYTHRGGTSKFDLTLTAVEFGERVHLSFEYCTQLFKPATIERFIAYFKKISGELPANLDRDLAGIEIITQDERDRVLYEFNNTRADYPAEKTIHELFTGQVERTPDQVALHGCMIAWMHGGAATDDDSALPVRLIQLTYSELNERSGRLAGLLIEKGIQPDTIVGIMIERSVDMIIGILGILKAGGAYMPIDPDYPKERIDYMLADSSAKILLTGQEIAGLYSPQASYLSEGHHPSFPASQLPNFPASLPSSLAYVIYTSGSTGKPKGITVEHRSVINFIKGITDIIPFRESDRILSLTTIAFDIFGLETLVPFSQGSCVVLGSRELQLDTAAASIIIQRENISIFQVTPSRLQMMISFPGAASSLGLLEFLLVGGESFPGPLLEKVRPLLRGKIYNMYGPTETTIWSTLKDLSGNKALNIGKPIANTQVYIVDGAGKLQPVGVVGELCIGGDGLARGYLNRPGLTAEKFIMPSATRGFFEKPPLDPAKLLFNYHSTTHHSPLTIYHTGDLARWLPDGNIEFLGRMDFQVKIRGFRIELGEIENHLMKHPHVKDAVAIDLETDENEKYLCAYIVIRDGKKLDIPGLQAFLSGKLPLYMIPDYFIHVEAIPLTSSGKVDRKALQSKGSRLSTGMDFEEPRDDIEKRVANTWKEILKLGRIGINDSFFSLGGNSIKLIRVNTSLKEVFNHDIPITKMFEHPTIKSLSNYLKHLEKSSKNIQPQKENQIEDIDVFQEQSLNILAQTMQIIKDEKRHE
jgi:amino acid adenylation domain-containing protein